MNIVAPTIAQSNELEFNAKFYKDSRRPRFLSTTAVAVLTQNESNNKTVQCQGF